MIDPHEYSIVIVKKLREEAPYEGYCLEIDGLATIGDEPGYVYNLMVGLIEYRIAKAQATGGSIPAPRGRCTGLLGYGLDTPDRKLH